ncbi:MAG TPA: DNA polymerase domain-containing protein [Polyangiaceae bacterium]|nr:DNA polymerase domain-containing protein [Polyangiaceae bacterium]
MSAKAPPGAAPAAGEGAAAAASAAPAGPPGEGARDEVLFGWDDTPGIVSVWADRDGSAFVWRRERGALVVARERFEAWALAASPRDWEAARAARAPGHDAVRCDELAGPEGSYRYRLSAPSARRLEAFVTAGAARRLGRPVASLRELGDAYYEQGPAEQYLSATGRAYFGGLAYGDLCRMQIDLETTALEPERGHIFLAAVRTSGGFEATLEATTEREERALLERLCELVARLDPDVIENHNLFGFDLPFLVTRAAKLGVPLALGRGGEAPRPFRVPSRFGGRLELRYRLRGRELIDTLDAVRRYDFVARELPSHRLKDVARHFGLAPPGRTYIDGADVHDTFRRAPERVRRYALDDVREVDALSRRLLGPAFGVARMAPRRYEQLATAGPAMGVLEPLLVRAYLRAGAAPPRKDPSPPPGRHAGGAVFLFATGVAERVVKADVASLYPSIMHAYQVGPACDRLGALLRVVGALLGRRLAHKAASKRPGLPAARAGYHDAMQAAMKLLLNSAYGYMGATGMALFADLRAADEVTRRGRELLGVVIGALREGGATLLEADTDGVFFAAPAGASEAGERALVAAAAARLPPGIRLEYEGRFRAMFSHEVKNYALLTYGGDLRLRGVALRSSRAEPFGERFLREALRATLEGDVPAVRRAFLATVDALRSRALPTADVAARLRLSKSPAEYAKSRPSHREAPYEAMLASGRTTWTPGERVLVYRAEGRGHRLSPEPPAPDPRDYDAEHYVALLSSSYAARLRKAFAPDDWAQLFRLDGQRGLFDPPLEGIAPLRVGAASARGEAAP